MSGNFWYKNVMAALKYYGTYGVVPMKFFQYKNLYHKRNLKLSRYAALNYTIAFKLIYVYTRARNKAHVLVGHC